MSDAHITDSIKKFVPGEVLAAYIALDSFIPYDEAVESWLTPFSIIVLGILLAIFVYRREDSAKIITAIGVVFLFICWCSLVSVERSSNIADIYTVKATATVVIILLSTAFVLFDVRFRRDVQAEPKSEVGAKEPKGPQGGV